MYALYRVLSDWFYLLHISLIHLIILIVSAYPQVSVIELAKIVKTLKCTLGLWAAARGFCIKDGSRGMHAGWITTIAIAPLKLFF